MYKPNHYAILPKQKVKCNFTVRSTLPLDDMSVI